MDLTALRRPFFFCFLIVWLLCSAPRHSSSSSLTHTNTNLLKIASSARFDSSSSSSYYSVRQLLTSLAGVAKCALSILLPRLGSLLNGRNCGCSKLSPAVFFFYLLGAKLCVFLFCFLNRVFDSPSSSVMPLVACKWTQCMHRLYSPC